MKNDTLDHLISFRVSAEEKKEIDRLSEKEERKLADMARRIFRVGLRAMARAK